MVVIFSDLWSNVHHHRIREHLENTTLMKRIDNGAKGERVLLLGEYKPKSGQSSSTALAIVEQTLIELALAEGYALLNTAGTKTCLHAVRCSGFRRAKQFSGSKMYIKKSS
jgi:hypothetical protein